MDGFGVAFEQEACLSFSPTPGYAAGILYVEDFDAQPPEEVVLQPAQVDIQPPLQAAQDVEKARQEGRAEGLEAALVDARLLQGQLHTAALQSLVDGMTNARTTFERVVRSHATDTARTIISLLQAALPAMMARHCKVEVDAVLQAILPGLASEPELRLRSHPDLACVVRESVSSQLQHSDLVLSVIADASLAPGDVQVAWRDGSARRDCKALWSDIRAALGPLDLPTFEEINHGH